MVHIRQAVCEALAVKGISSLNKASFNALFPLLRDKKLLATELKDYLQTSETMPIDYIQPENSIRNTSKQLIGNIKHYLNHRGSGSR